ncbi:RNA-directed DNA polymerase, eukaryota, partial [Tanacetum coccineum]
VDTENTGSDVDGKENVCDGDGIENVGKGIEARDKFLNHKGILTWFSTLKPWYNDFVVDERLVWLEIEGVPIRAWDNQEIGDQGQESNHATPKPDGLNEVPSVSDPFELDELIKKSGKSHKPCQSVTPEFPPGFSSILKGEQVISDSVHNLSDGEQIKHPSFSMLERLEETIKVGLDLGLNLKGCEMILASLINENGDEAETKMLQVDLWMLRQIWGNVHFDFASTSARGMSGGILCLWNSLVFRKSHIVCNDNYVVIDGLWIPNDVQVRWIVVYAPQSLSGKITLWTTLENLLSNWDGISVIMGDFNEVRDEGERYGSVFCDRQARIFNEFIANNSLIDVSLGGYNFTWTNKWGTKMSKLDRFLVSESFYEMFPHAIGLVLEKGIPDHRPILIKEAIVDYGPTPFRFFHSWLEIEGFHELVVQTWKNDGIVDGNGFVLFKKKLQNLKKVIRVWIATRKADAHVLKKEHQLKLSTIDSKIDQGCASEEDFKIRRDSLAILGDLDRIEAKDFAQKAKIKWALEGDENTSFFHGTLKKKRRQLAIRGILKNGDWVDAPGLVKEEFLTHFRDRFKRHNGPPIGIDSLSFNTLSQIHRDYLELPFSRDEIKRAVWECGGDRAPGPDDAVMGKMGFGAKWRSWISGCLHKARSSILVNGSPTNEFELFKGLRQGDPLSPFLFILVMEGLHSLTCKAEELGLFKGVSIGCDNMNISHLMYADDVIFFGEWSWVNAQNLISMLRCFYLISGLKINIDKSKSDVHETDASIGVRLPISSILLSYLGKARLLPLEWAPAFVIKGFGGAMFFRGADQNDSKMAWIKWEKCLSSKKKGGLVSMVIMEASLMTRIVGLSLTFLLGTIMSSVKMASLRTKVIVYLSYVLVSKVMCSMVLGNDTWCENSPLKLQFPQIYNLDTDRNCLISNRIPFNWSSVLRRLPRGGAELNQFEALGEAIRNVSLTDQSNSWTWSIGVGYSVASTRVLVDEKLLDSSLDATRWIRYIPIKVNVFLWRLNLNKLPYRVNLDRKGIEAKWWELDIGYFLVV